MAEPPVWVGDWKHRIRARMAVQGFPSLAAFLAAHPGLSYGKLADLLSVDRDVAAVQIEHLHAEMARSSPEARELALRDSLVRLIRGALRKGWRVDKYWESKVLGAFGTWIVMWGQEAWLRRVRDVLFEEAPQGWIPDQPDDVWIVKAIEAAQRAFLAAPP